MKLLPLLAWATWTAAASGTAFAADPATADATSNAATVHAKKGARSVKNDRLRKCKVMQGDEKKACQKDAEADASTMMRHGSTDHKAGANSPQTPSK